jgi:thiamine biosynthesis lipoprotein
MGGRAQIRVVGDPLLAERGRARLADLEAKWSRFLADSDVSRANGAAGVEVRVSSDTIDVCTRAVEAHRFTGGRFNPLFGRQLRQLGYDRSFDQLEPDRTGPVPPSSAIGLVSRLRIDRLRSTITVPEGSELDLGGIGKGLAADVVAAEMVAAGADGALVDLGGDLRVQGAGPTDHGWSIAVEDPVVAGRELLRLHLSDGGVASSGRHLRRWRWNGTEHHHLLDESGSCVTNRIVAVTVLADDAWRAEALTKDIIVGGEATALARLEHHGVDGLVILDDGSQIATAALRPAA